MRMLTYGVLPSRKEFKAAFDATMAMDGTETYAIRHGSAQPDWQVPAGNYTANELWSELERLEGLGFIGEDESGDGPGDMASSILQTLGFEWV